MGQVQVMFPGLTASIAYIRSGKLRPLADATTATRSQVLPDLPTVGDFVPDYKCDIRARSAQRHSRRNRRSPQRRNRCCASRLSNHLSDCQLGAAMLAGSRADFGTLIAEEIEKWAKVVKFSGAKPD